MKRLFVILLSVLLLASCNTPAPAAPRTTPAVVRR